MRPELAAGAPWKADPDDCGWIAPAWPRGAAISSGNGVGLASATAVGFGLATAAGAAAGRAAAVVEPRRSTGLAACAGEAGAADAVCVWAGVSFGVNSLLRKLFVASTLRSAADGCAAAVCVGWIAAAWAGLAAGC